MVRFLLKNLGPDHQAAIHPWVLVSMGYSSVLYQVLQLGTTQSALDNIKAHLLQRKKYYKFGSNCLVFAFIFFFTH